MSLRIIFSSLLPRLLFILLISALSAGCVSNSSWNAAQWLEQGNRFAKDGLYSNAVDAYNQSINLDASNAKVFTYRGVALQHLGADNE